MDRRHARTTPSADFCVALRKPLSSPSPGTRDATQISRGNSNCLPCIVAESTFCAFDGYGLRGTVPARPALTPHIRFLFIDSHVRYALLSGAASRRSPLRFAYPSPPSGWIGDFHPGAVRHARHTPPRRFSTAHRSPPSRRARSAHVRRFRRRDGACEKVFARGRKAATQ